MRMNVDWRRARVVATERVASDVRKVVFAVDGLLPDFDAGSHTNIKVLIDGTTTVRTYTCLPASAGTLAIAVKQHPNSRGGSRFIWGLEIDDIVQMTVPENRFELSWRAPHYLLLAGGIGITPIYGMAKALLSRGQSVRLAYGAQSNQVMPFVDELKALLGTNLELFCADEGRNIDLAKEIAALPPTGELYVCGPLGMLNAVKAAWAPTGRPVSRLRYEVFGDNGKFTEAPFQVSVTNKNLTVTVRPDQSMLDALVQAGVDMIYDCQRGECGLCAVKIVEVDGTVDHRDVFFSDHEKDKNEHMCACVSRLSGGHAVIDTGYRL